MPIARTLLAAALVTQASVFATTVYLHRVLAHRSLTVRPAVALLFRAVLWVTTGIAPRAWVAVHRKHHAFSDTSQDPHSPVVLGFWAVQVGN
ncbi:MAG TPA: fatty acid desaturase, partial [Acidimicrobiia bacterium]